MKLNGTHKFKASSTRVFNAILNPEILKTVIPGCESIDFVDNSHIRANITTPLPGLKGPFGIVIGIANRQDPHYLELHVQRQGRGGSVNAVSKLQFTDEADGALLNYDANADLSGPVAMASNPIGQGMVKKQLGDIFKNLDNALS